MQCCSVQSLKYLGAQFVAAKKLKCSVDNVRLKFYRTFNAIYSRSKGAQSLQLFKSYCLSFMLYATEVMPLSKHSLKTLDFCVNRAVAKICNTCDKDCIMQIWLFCDLPDVSVLIERRRMNFMNNMLDNKHLRYLSLFWVHCWRACVFYFLLLSFFYLSMVGLVVCIMYVLPFWRNKDIYKIMYVHIHWNRQTDGRLTAAQFHRRCSAYYMYAISVVDRPSYFSLPDCRPTDFV